MELFIFSYSRMLFLKKPERILWKILFLLCPKALFVCVNVKVFGLAVLMNFLPSSFLDK